MIQMRRILCPTDFSGCSRHAFDHAVALGRWYEAEITVLHVLPLVPSATVFPPVMSPITLEPIPRERVGSTAHHVIRESHLPVLTIRGR